MFRKIAVKLDYLAAFVYLDMQVALSIPDKYPAFIAAKWYHLFWIILPPIGYTLFLSNVEDRFRSLKPRCLKIY